MCSSKNNQQNTPPKLFCPYTRFDYNSKAVTGSPGYDNESLEFEKDLKNNLYKLWNRLPSRTYYPPPVSEVETPKADGKTRKLGIPTVRDRIAQTLIKRYLEPIAELHFHEDSYDYSS